MMKTTLTFGRGNAKFGTDTYTFSLPAGYSCPGANECLARADRETGSITDGADTRFRCFAASMESRNPTVRKSRWNNFEALRACTSFEEMVLLILGSLPAEAPRVRIHVSGDFYTAEYFRAWCQVAETRPQTLFYAYTKSLKIWVDNRHLVPSNFKLTASRGGRWDHFIDRYLLKYAEVVFSEAQAQALGLALDHEDEDRLAYAQDKSFALLLHGTQKAGTPAAKALSALKRSGFTGYSKTKKQTVTA